MYLRSITTLTVAIAVLAASAADPTSTTPTESGAATPKITPGPEDEMSRECLSEVAVDILGDVKRKEPSGPLGDLIKSEQLLASANIPTSECALLSKIPATLHEEYFTFESQRSEWWKSRRTDFSKWASTCHGHFPTTDGPGWGDAVTPYQSHSAFLDTYDPAKATTCEGITRGPPASTTAESGSERSPPKAPRRAVP
ncbi:hypothetical protein PG997_014412 [Apiospora hydei]|uniref:Uncharacterized protein n=1 Tax=Apiospora hydei TaxID=1337664 RepID=A0ABR1UW90_9PEZI